MSYAKAGVRFCFDASGSTARVQTGRCVALNQRDNSDINFNIIDGPIGDALLEMA